MLLNDASLSHVFNCLSLLLHVDLVEWTYSSLKSVNSKWRFILNKVLVSVIRRPREVELSFWRLSTVYVFAPHIATLGLMCKNSLCARFLHFLFFLLLPYGCPECLILNNLVLLKTELPELFKSFWDRLFLERCLFWVVFKKLAKIWLKLITCFFSSLGHSHITSSSGTSDNGVHTKVRSLGL